MAADSIRVLYVTSECAPLAKTGGLADVSGALPAALRRLSADVRLLMPAYRGVLAQLAAAVEVEQFAATPYFPAARLFAAAGPEGVPLLILDCPPLYDRDGGPYQDASGIEWPDNALRFGLLSRVAADLGSDRSRLVWRPQVVHCNDWQAGLAPAYLHFDAGASARTLITIHNLAFQGVFEPQWVARLGLPAASFGVAGVEYYGQLSFLKAAIRYAGAINTVSPTYAGEIQHEPLGMGMQGLLSERSGVLSGILHGIDTVLWDPRRDSMIAQNYDAQTRAGKLANKRALQARLGLAADPDLPLLVMVSRLTHQKGIDLVLGAAPALLALGAQVAVLGSGEREHEQQAAQLAAAHPGQVAVVIGFDEDLAHLMEAGGDIFLMPSRYEPCGMNQMYSQRYGTVPVVHATGGLIDSVVDCNDATLADGTASGIVFHEPTVQGFTLAVSRAIEAHRNPALWHALQAGGMARDFGWAASAGRYVEIYTRLAGD